MQPVPQLVASNRSTRARAAARGQRPDGLDRAGSRVPVGARFGLAPETPRVPVRRDVMCRGSSRGCLPSPPRRDRERILDNRDWCARTSRPMPFPRAVALEIAQHARVDERQRIGRVQSFIGLRKTQRRGCASTRCNGCAPAACRTAAVGTEVRQRDERPGGRSRRIFRERPRADGSACRLPPRDESRTAGPPLYSKRHSSRRPRAMFSRGASRGVVDSTQSLGHPLRYSVRLDQFHHLRVGRHGPVSE